MSPGHACLACLEAVGVTGAGLTVMGSKNALEPVYVTDPRVGEVEELQATLGEGPGTDALESGRPMLVGDLAAPMSNLRWPMFASEAGRLGLWAMHSLPLALGAIQVGVLDLYNDTPGHLNQDQLVDALIYADTALLLVLDALSGIATPVDAERPSGHGPVLWRAEVHQAAGILSERLGVSPLEALVRLRRHAYAHNKRFTDVARSVVEGRLRFQPEAKPSTDPGV
ncbi:MAG TPA: GAF and ANTAR domain-containing protein [Mycobacterium sp.]|nr:GAF and ANTAR domain-containing protein [Mycobacterium sp.]HTX95420.1 GAF and ANTAR domain-containing protein [Mycobacterium sp.]